MIDVTVNPLDGRGSTPWRIGTCGWDMERGENVVHVHVADQGAARRHFWAKRVREGGLCTGKVFSRWLADKEAEGYNVIYQGEKTA